MLVLGVGNTLMQDDGVGSHVIEALRETCPAHSGIRLIDGGTIGLALLPEIESADSLIFIDATEMGEQPGTIKLFYDEEIDRLLSGKRRTVHEVALADLLSAAAIRGCLPRRRVLVAIQPESTDWGPELSATVQAAVPGACRTITRLADQWRTAEAAA